MGSNQHVLDYMIANRESLVKFCEMISEHRGYGDDVYQETYIRLSSRALPNMSARGAVIRNAKFFLLKVLRQTWNRSLRHPRSSPLANTQLDLPSLDAWLTASDEASGVEGAHAKLTLDHIRETLGDRDYAVLVMEPMGYSREEIGEVTGLSPSYVNTCRKQARRKLRAAGLTLH